MFPAFKEQCIVIDKGEIYESDDEDYIEFQGQFKDKRLFLNINETQNEEISPNKQLRNVEGTSRTVTSTFPNDPSPSLQELNLSLTKIKTKFPHVNIISLITKLYVWMQERQRLKDLNILPDIACNKLTFTSEEGAITDEFKEAHFERSRIIRLGNNKFIITNKGMLPKQRSLFQRFKEIKTTKEYRRIEREVGARAFCDRGYGIPKLRQQISSCGIDIQIDDKRYKAVSCGFATQTYRRMEKFMIEDCKQSMKSATSNQLKVLYTILLNCRDNFQKNEAETYVKFVKLTYQLGQVEITLDETVKLYNRFIESLHAKVKQQKYSVDEGTFQMLKQSKNIKVAEAKPNLDILWTPQREKQFYTIYLKERTLNAVRKYFKDRYDPIKQSQFQSYYPKTIQSAEPKNKSNFLSIQSSVQFSFFQTITDLKKITSKFHQTMRGGLRKIETFSKKNPKAIKLLRANDNVVKAMFGNAQASEVRKAIFQYQLTELTDPITPDFANSTIQVINEFIEMKTSNPSEINKERQITNYNKKK